jgi:hypothetical protein
MVIQLEAGKPILYYRAGRCQKNFTGMPARFVCFFTGDILPSGKLPVNRMGRACYNNFL